MVVGLIESRLSGLTAWVPYVQSRAVDAQSSVRRFDRWRHNQRIDVPQLYGPRRPQAVAEWGDRVWSLALDPSTLWDTYGMVRVSSI
jgi:hypothetical protein